MNPSHRVLLWWARIPWFQGSICGETKLFRSTGSLTKQETQHNTAPQKDSGNITLSMLVDLLSLWLDVRIAD